MTVSELIKHLEKMPQDATIWHLWDGALGTQVKHVWLARSGVVATADDHEVCYSDEGRPADAPTSKENPYWHTPDSPDPTTTPHADQG